MARTVSIGNQDFESIREKNCFYVDKTNFIKEWWESEIGQTYLNSYEVRFFKVDEKKTKFYNKS